MNVDKQEKIGGGGSVRAEEVSNHIFEIWDEVKTIALQCDCACNSAKTSVTITQI